MFNFTKKKIAAVLVAIGIVIGIILYRLNLKRKKLTIPDNANLRDLKLSLASVKNNPKVSEKLIDVRNSLNNKAKVPFNKNLWLLNYAEGDFANTDYVPFSLSISGKRFSEKNFEANKAKMQELIIKKDEEVTRQSELWKVPRYLIYGIFAIENFEADSNSVNRAATAKYTRDSFGGKPLEYNQAVGNMMIKPYTATDSLRIAIKQGVLQEPQAFALQNLANSNRIDKALSKSDLGDIIITQDLLKISEFNIAVGTAKLATLMLKYGTEIYKIGADYNQGEYFISNKRLNSYKSFETFTAQLTNSEVIEYTKNLCGKFGTLDILVNHLGIKD
jgi:hypothetical protein